MLSQLERALKGNEKAALAVLRMAGHVDLLNGGDGSADGDQLSPADEKILAQLLGDQKTLRNGEVEMSSLKDIKLSPAVLRALADDKIRNDFMSFVIKVFETILPGEHLHLNWHIAAMAYQLDQIRLGKSRRLVITIPPRHLKSIVVSVALTAFLWGTTLL